jgi:hypothetical protein
MELYELLALVVETFTRLRIPYLVTGSVASMAYGEPRLTNDIDVVAGIREEHVAGLLAAFPADTFYLSPEAIQEAILRQGQFNILHPGVVGRPSSGPRLVVPEFSGGNRSGGSDFLGGFEPPRRKGREGGFLRAPGRSGQGRGSAVNPPEVRRTTPGSESAKGRRSRGAGRSGRRRRSRSLGVLGALAV